VPSPMAIRHVINPGRKRATRKERFSTIARNLAGGLWAREVTEVVVFI
jgi:hypothetical protein